MVAKDIDDNCELAKVLEVLALLIKYGYYDDPDDVEEVLRPLVEVMNGLSDLPFLQATLLKSGSASSECRVQGWGWWSLYLYRCRGG